MTTKWEEVGGGRLTWEGEACVGHKKGKKKTISLSLLVEAIPESISSWFLKKEPKWREKFEKGRSGLLWILVLGKLKQSGRQQQTKEDLESFSNSLMFLMIMSYRSWVRSWHWSR